tara:strand:- start:2656 stop:4650 length:1995 start_codon:yes stop_codon:yes gene_type:complete
LRYLTKSRFKQGLECTTKLFYTNKKDEYANTSNEDSFLQSLAEGGFQVGELAKFYFHDNPIEESITIESSGEEAIIETKERLSKKGRVVIAEAAFKFNNLFVRIDILVKEDDQISIYEVKAKSWDVDKDSFFDKNKTKITSPWMPYVYDVAFQKYVVSNALKKGDIKAYLTLVDKSKTVELDGMNQFFMIDKTGDQTTVRVKEGLRRSHLGEVKLLINKNVNDECWKIEHDFPVPTDLGERIMFTEFIQRCSYMYENDIKTQVHIGKKCKDCQFHNKNNSELKSGFNECWLSQTNLTERQLKEENLSMEIWGGGGGSRSFSGELIEKGIYLLKDVKKEDVAPLSSSPKVYNGLSPLERRMEQINRVKEGVSESYFDTEGFKEKSKEWVYPLHMIDFETSAVALPFFKGMKPYETIAFQFSHHTIDEDWNIKHENQYLCFEKNTFPNFKFVRALKEALSKDKGTIFRYHNHENTTLNKIREQLLASTESIPDKEELICFIEEITHDKGRKAGERDMVDLFKLVTSYYYSPYAKGSNSIKVILPAIISESKFLQDKYGKLGVYGKGLEINSLNCTNHQWIKSGDLDPYKSLDPVFPEYGHDEVEKIKGLEELNDGGAALTAYNFLQYSNITDKQREKLQEALYKYCELDTMAMVMIMEAWREMIKE